MNEGKTERKNVAVSVKKKDQNADKYRNNRQNGQVLCQKRPTVIVCKLQKTPMMT